MKKIIIMLVMFISIFMLTGCDGDNETIVSNGKKVNTSKMGHKHCTREANGGEGMIVNLNYDLYYKGEELTLLKSVEQVVATKDSDLDLYENAYNSIKKNYEGLEYYDQDVVRGDTAVTNTIIINYEKIDIQALLDIEGEEDNIIEDGVAKVDKWITLAKKFGTKCEEVTEE